MLNIAYLSTQKLGKQNTIKNCRKGKRRGLLTPNLATPKILTSFLKHRKCRHVLARPKLNNHNI